MQIWTPLHHAALRDEEDVVRLLLAHGATPDDMSKVSEARFMLRIV